MAEAHVAVAFSFAITHEGVNINYDREVLHLIWESGLRSWKKRFSRFLNNIRSGIYPASLSSLFILITIMLALQFAGLDISFGAVSYMDHLFPQEKLAPLTALVVTSVVDGFCIWLAIIMILRYTLKLLLMYKGWLFDGRTHKKASLKTVIWAGLVKTLTMKRQPMLYSFQGSLPRLPLPRLEDTMARYLESVRPLLDNEQYEKMVEMTKEFESGVGKKLQWFLRLKSWWSSNYVTDWWEEYVYLRGRSPLLVYSNCYGLDYMPLLTKSQTARAANFVYSAMIFRKQLNSQTLKPVAIQNFIPLCAWQYERMFNTTRIPGKEKDKVVHLVDGSHIIVFNKGRYFKMELYNKNGLLKPAEIQMQLERIVQDTTPPSEGEEHLAALTANNRTLWAEAREKYFSEGANKASLKTIESAAFVLVLDDEENDFDEVLNKMLAKKLTKERSSTSRKADDDQSKLTGFSRAILHGKGYNLWLDKSFNVVVTKNGRLGCNCEHSWCDSPIMSHFWEFCIAKEALELKYDAAGNTIGKVESIPPSPSKLKWDLHPECIDLVRSSVLEAQAIINEVDLKVYYHSNYGKGFVKKCKVSPDAYVQMVLQLAYYRDTGKFDLTYEASMMRLFREGRTETVRPVTLESCAFVRGVDDPALSAKEKLALLQRACHKHQESYLNVMCGKGIDRHLFCLYVVSKYLEVESPFLKAVLGEPWRLSTSQTPHNQTGALDPRKHPEYICLGGGFGPVADDGYGVSYDIASEDAMFFHVTSKRSSPETDTQRFIGCIQKALHDVRQLYEASVK